MNFEDELRLALRREEPSPDFAERVLARAAAPRRSAARPWMAWMAAAAAVLLVVSGGLEYRHYEGERAKSQVLLAVRIAGSKLNKAQRKVQMLTHRSVS